MCNINTAVVKQQLECLSYSALRQKLNIHIIIILQDYPSIIYCLLSFLKSTAFIQYNPCFKLSLQVPHRCCTQRVYKIKTLGFIFNFSFILLFKFRVPYYGSTPVNDAHRIPVKQSKSSWFVLIGVR